MGSQLREMEERQTSGHHLLREQTQSMAIQPRSEGHGVGKGSSSRPAILLDLVGMMLAREEERVLGFHDFDINIHSVGEVTWLGTHSMCTVRLDCVYTGTFQGRQAFVSEK